MDQPSENHNDDRRAFLKEGIKKAALLPYVAPVIETISLSDAHAQGRGRGRGNGNSGQPSVIGNGRPPNPPPKIRNIHPNQGLLGETMSIAINGDSFRIGARVEFGSGISVKSVRYDSKRLLTVLIEISDYTSEGWRDVTVINPDRQTDTKDRALTIKRPPAPKVNSVHPDEQYQDSNFTVTIKGEDFREHFNLSFGSGILVSEEKYINDTTLSAKLTILSTATPGYRDVTIVHSDRQEDTDYNAFKVKEKKSNDDDDDDDDDDN